MMKAITKNLAVFGLASTLGFSLSGCGVTSDSADVTKESSASEEIEDIDIEESKYFDVGEHLFFERYYLASSVNSQDIAGGSVSIPEGYSVYDIENFTYPYRYGSETGGYDVWFLNDVPVEAEKVYNEVLEIYDYSEPGTPVLEKSDATVQKVK